MLQSVTSAASAKKTKLPEADVRHPCRVPKDAGDQANIDLVEVFDASGTKYFVVHMVDHATRFQLAGLMKGKSTGEVISFIRRHWLPIFGPPRVLVCDQGREFVSWEMEEFASAHSILLWHAAVGAPWQNGICERCWWNPQSDPGIYRQCSSSSRS